MKFIAALIVVQSCRWVLCRGEEGDQGGAGASGYSGNLRQGNTEDDPGADGYGASVDDVRSALITPVTLDLTAQETEDILKQTRYAGRTEISDYTIYTDMPIVKVVDGDKTVWVGNVDYPCTSAKLVSRGRDYKSLVLFVGSGYNAEYKYFDMVENTWRELSEEEKEERIGKKKSTKIPLSEDTKPKTDSSFVLDIEHPDTTKIEIDQSTNNGVTRKTYKDIEGSKMVYGSGITSVVSGTFTFWTKGEFEVLKKCDEFFDATRRLVYIRVNSFGLTKRFCFENDGRGWKNIDRQELKSKLKEMEKDQEDPYLVETQTNETSDLLTAVDDSNLLSTARKLANGLLSGADINPDIPAVNRSEEVTNGLGEKTVANENKEIEKVSGFYTSSITLFMVTVALYSFTGL
ncbi:signal peptide containing protein [Theileria equi strain WA]|uniref:Signal peptide containing protein n=1 Tax=Theileria equi strain WA TaxID=1537102 RepID=L1LDJ2_THEEQ|nr:signal peptide containing protein [Theileria equi strain WA]EKX73305.1 signal peptide containing protein [Theileria equi strain WA]|eukprot:XP_004832757.1 signal peptide containing protein [Theileria equi strain WA]